MQPANDYLKCKCTGKGGWTFDMKGEGVSRRGFEPGSRPFFFFFFFFFFCYWRKNAGIVRLGMCEACYFLELNLVLGKPYREVCLQTLLWPWKVHRPSSWSLLLSELALKALKDGNSFFFFFFMAFLGCIEHTFNKWGRGKCKKKKDKLGFLGFDPGASESKLASDALQLSYAG